MKTLFKLWADVRHKKKNNINSMKRQKKNDEKVS